MARGSTLLALLLAVVACRQVPSSAVGERPDAFLPADPKLEVVVVPDLSTLAIESRQSVRRRELLLAERLAATGSGGARLGAAYGELGKAYHAFGYPASAVEAYRNAGRLQPSEFRWPYYLAHVLKEVGEAEALAAVRAARELRPDYVAAVLLEADLRLATGELNRAEALFRRALEIDPESAAAWFGVGRVAAERGDPAAAVAAFEAALRSRPDASIVHYPLALAYRQLGDVERARIHLEQRGELWPGVFDPVLDEVLLSNPEAWAIRGLNALRSGNPAAAARDLERAVELAPRRHDIRLHLGAAWARLGRPERALDEYRAASELVPESAPVHFNMGVVLARLGRDDEALAALRRAVALDPGHKAARFQCGRRLVVMGEPGEALDHLDALLDLDPNHPAARLWRARALAALGRRDEALAAVAEHERLYPGDAATERVRAEVEGGERN